MKLLYLSDNPNSATSFYRGAGVLKYLSIDYDVLNPNLIELTWSFMIQYDLVWIERPSSDRMLFICENFKKIGIPIIVDYDDALFHIPSDNRAFHHYQQIKHILHPIQCNILLKNYESVQQDLLQVD